MPRLMKEKAREHFRFSHIERETDKQTQRKRQRERHRNRIIADKEQTEERRRDNDTIQCLSKVNSTQDGGPFSPPFHFSPYLAHNVKLQSIDHTILSLKGPFILVGDLFPTARLQTVVTVTLDRPVRQRGWGLQRGKL